MSEAQVPPIKSAGSTANNFGSAKHLLITGASGFIAGALIAVALRQGLKVSALTRSPAKLETRFPGLRGYADPLQIPSNCGVDAVVHLSGANVFALPWTAARKRSLRASRIGIAERLQQAIAGWQQAPACWIQASAVGFYPTQSTTVLTEQSAPGTHFAAQLCQEIEASALRAETLGMRTVNLRIGLVMGRSGGVYPLMRLGTLLSGASVLGSGDQRVAWIHIDDLVSLIARCISDAPCEHGQVSRERHGGQVSRERHGGQVCGAINAVAPQSPTYKEFATAMAGALNRPCWLKIPQLALKLTLGERAPLMLEGAEISAEKALAIHKFAYATVSDCFRNLR